MKHVPAIGGAIALLFLSFLFGYSTADNAARNRVSAAIAMTQDAYNEAHAYKTMNKENEIAAMECLERLAQYRKDQ